MENKMQCNSLFREFLLWIILISSICCGDTRTAFSAGPMLHWNFGLSKVSFSLGVEASYWNYYSFPKSIDFGIDFEKSAIRVYSELQTGLIFFGLSAGLVSEFKENNVSFGFQGSTWGNLYGGLDLRYRRINEVNFICPGLYAKCPFLLKGTWI